MTSERWRNIERLYFAALERDVSQRPSFLEQACAGDENLRHEVESLLQYQPQAEGFIETVATAAVRMLPRQVEGVPGRFAGCSFGPYRLEALIATGGSGEVYRGLDTRVGRTVAVKVLHPHYSKERHWRERFEREARVISSLNHPHICTLFDVGTHEETGFLVMEFVTGETLRDRLSRGPLPLAVAIQHAIQILEALQVAHGAGFIHRDLKPENIMLTGTGLKVLDFGLATRPESASPAGSEGVADPANGSLVFGTPGYCSPEQLEGKAADARTDIFSFGLLLYEMVRGRRAFAADNPVRLFGATLYETPRDVRDFDSTISPGFALVLNRCFAKDPSERWQSVADLLFMLRHVGSAPALEVPSPPTQKRRWRTWVAAGCLSLVAAILAAVWLRSHPRAAAIAGPADIRFPISASKGTELYSGYDVPFAVSPDGRRVAFVAVDQEGTRRLWVRSLSSETGENKPLRGTEGVQSPFWSPDGEWIGFFAANSLKKIRVSHESVQIVAARASTKGGASWNRRDVIIFPSVDSEKISKVSAQGGEAISLQIEDSTAGSQFWPQFLSDGEHFVYAAGAAREIRIGSLTGRSSRFLMKFPLRISSVAYVPGFLFFVQDGVLFARPFDEKVLGFVGETIRIVEGIPVTPPGQAAFSVSASGVLAYWPHPGGTPATLDWIDRAGRATPAVTSPAQYVGLSLSSDGKRVAFSRRASDGGADLWIRELASSVERQLTFDKAAFAPHWSPDGSRLIFSGPGLGPPPKPILIDLSASGGQTLAGSWLTPTFASSWHPNEPGMICVRFDPVTRNDLWNQPLPSGPATPLAVNTPANESEGTLSSDGRWLAFVTDQSGRDEVWVARFPGGEERRQVSVAGGASPRWRGDGRELFYVSADRQLMAVASRASGGGIEFGRPAPLFPVPGIVDVDYRIMPTAGVYAPAPDGSKFLIARRKPDSNASPLRLLANWRLLVKR